MTVTEAKEAIKRRWMALWPTLSGNTPYSFDAIAKPQAPVFAVMTIAHTDGEELTIGPHGKNENPGMIVVRIETPQGSGTKAADQLCDVVKRIFQRRVLGAKQNDEGVRCHKSNVSELVRDRESPDRWVATVTTPFEYFDRTL